MYFDKWISIKSTFLYTTYKHMFFSDFITLLRAWVIDQQRRRKKNNSIKKSQTRDLDSIPLQYFFIIIFCLFNTIIHLTLFLLRQSDHKLVKKRRIWYGHFIFNWAQKRPFRAWTNPINNFFRLFFIYISNGTDSVRRFQLSSLVHLKFCSKKCRRVYMRVFYFLYI